MKRAARGYVLLPVAIAIALIGVIAYLAATESAMENRLGSGEQEATRAGYVAQAGMQHALRQVAQQGCGPHTDLSSVAFDVDRYSSSLTASLGATTNYTIAVDQDGWINEKTPYSPNGTQGRIEVAYDGVDEVRALLHYDLSAVPAGSSVLSATAWFYVEDDFPGGSIDIHRLSQAWIEDESNWNTMGDNIYDDVLASLAPQTGTNRWIAVNLTAQAQAWVNGEENNGIALRTLTPGLGAKFSSRESPNPPYLELIVGTLSTADAKLKSIGMLASGVSHEITRAITLRQQPDSFRQLQLGASSGQDAMLDSFYSARNFGDHELKAKEVGSGQTQQSLIRFDLPAIPPGADIISARLELFHNLSTGIQVDPVVDIHRMTRDWVEGSKSGSGTADGATWDTPDGIVNWTSAGGDFEAAAVASSAISAAPDDWESWEIGELVQGWIDGRYANHGLILKGSGDIDVSFVSKEGADAAQHPKLSIRYACACDQACVAPQGSGRILMAVVNPTTLVADDAYKKALFESWGFNVTVISESANQASYDAAMAAADVVFISDTVNSAQLGAKLVDASIGVVSQDGDYNAALGIAPGAAWPIAASIDITDASHYISAPFPTGDLTIYDAAMEQLSISGSGAAGLQSLADSAGNSSLAVLETGAQLSGGGSAAGRRVLLPLGRSGLFNWEQLNGNGRLLLQRALTWGARLDQVTENLLLVVANPGSLTASETARKTLFESWDYEVNLIDESDTQANYDAAIAANDVAYVAVDVNHSSLAGKLDTAVIGIVNEEAELGDDLGIAQTALYRDRDQIDIVDNTHFITEPFATGLLSVVDSLQPLHMLGADTAPGLMTLAQSFDAGVDWRPSLVAIETGGQLWGGGAATGRRVQLPWGGEAFDFGQLNDDGRVILQRALQWAASSAGGGPPIAHWKLDESAGVSALDSIAGNDGNLVNGPAWTPGLLQGSLDFDAADDRVDIGPAPDLDELFTSGATLTAWIYARGWGEGGFGRIADKSDSTALTAGWQLGLDGGGAALAFQSGFSGSAGAWSTPASSFSLDRWHHVALVYNGSSTSNTPAIYIDGVAQALSVDSTPSGTPAADAAYDLTLGNHAAAATRTFDGLLDDIRLYDRMLSAAQVAELAQFPGPVAHWRLDDGSGLTALDSAGGNHGSLVDGPAWTSGVLAGALDFDGVDDLVTAGTFDVVGSGITMTGWFRADALGSDEPRILSKADGPGATDAWWQLGITDAGADRYLQMRIKAGGVTTTLADSSVNLMTDKWYFAAATYDAVSGQMTLYLDAAEVASTTHAAGGAVDVDPTVAIAIGANGTAERFLDGLIDDPRVFNYALTTEQIEAIFDAVEVPDDIAYHERFQTWSASADDSWETVDLSAFAVPAGAVAEVAILNSDSGSQRSGGVRAVASLLDRRLLLNEAESGGFDAVTMQVQIDANGQIQHYAENKAEIVFVLLGYWSGVSYTELFSNFSAGADNAWTPADLSGAGVGANRVAEIAIVNKNNTAENRAGVRASASSLQRRVLLKEAESGGLDAVSMMVDSGAAASVEVFAEVAAEVDFYLLGQWASAPGVYTELGGSTGQVGAAASWQPTDVSGFGIAADSVAQFVLQNDSGNSNNLMGVRETGSGEARLIDLQEAESGGTDTVSMHVKVDAGGRVEWYAESGDAARIFHPVGWWALTP